MVRVCQKEIPLEIVRKQKPKAKYPGFRMHPGLKQQIDIYLKNIKNDWDFVIIISGEGEVRVGKSFLASQIAKYWQSEIKRIYGKDVPFNLKQNYVFNGDKLISKGNKLGTNHPNSPLIFDEAGADLEGRKSARRTTQNVMDFLRECGQYNMLTILILPEFFDLPKGVAISRSNCLINSYWLGDREGNMNRGYFKFYSRPNKKYLYIKGKKELDYNAWKQDFFGDFDNLFTLDLDEYKELKRKALKKREKISGTEIRAKEWLRSALLLLVDTYGNSYRELSDKLKQVSKIPISYVQIGRIINREKEQEDE